MWKGRFWCLQTSSYLIEICLSPLLFYNWVRCHFSPSRTRYLLFRFSSAKAATATCETRGDTGLGFLIRCAVMECKFSLRCSKSHLALPPVPFASWQVPVFLSLVLVHRRYLQLCWTLPFIFMMPVFAWGTMVTKRKNSEERINNTGQDFPSEVRCHGSRDDTVAQQVTLTQ